MNLTELRNKVKAITDYSPELAVYDEQLDQFINDAYFGLWTLKRWNFAYKTTYMDILPDVGPTDPSTGATIFATVTDNERRVTFSSSVNQFEIPYNFEGQIIQIGSRDYEIQKVLTTQNIQLTEPFRSVDFPAPLLTVTSNWTIKHRFYDLPQDAIELLYIGHRDTPIVGKQPPYGAVRGLLPRRDEDINLQEDYTSFYSECYIPVGSRIIPPGETWTAEFQDVGDDGDIPGGTYMEFCWAFEGEGGRPGPLSEPKITKWPSQGTNEIVLTFLTWDGIPVQAPTFAPGIDQLLNPFEGPRKRLYFNQNFDRLNGVRLKGLPVWREVTLGKAASTPSTPGYNSVNDPIRVPDTVATITVRYLNQIQPGNKRYNEFDGVKFRIRPYPRPIGYDELYKEIAGTEFYNTAPEVLFRRWEMRYYRRPFPLGLQTDVPEFPMEFHQLVVYKALEDIYSKHDNMNQATNYRNRYEKEIQRLEKRYVDSIDLDVVRQQFGGNGRIWTPFDPNSLRRLN